MSGNLEVYVPALAKAGKRMLEVKTSIGGVVERLAAEAGRYGHETWGTDEGGTEFAKTYLPQRTSLVGGGREVVKTLHSNGTGMVDAAKSLDGAEAHSAENF
ncbi:hypothetical protein [Nocardia arthritidis]|uniref:WXG100 family type VII secretion target n=1 Tax=Nocardia arthritidis TaxID=228602 RepID=A0A6G9YAM4_9NOCA|nr:hypothetical protein [Nocardia arthritidis]QIS10170.1 hypothetical protein F5544_11390 [Nocardia arthritidis]